MWLGLLNVWLIRARQATAWRAGEASTMREEFATYGLPAWFMVVIGVLKVTLAVALLVGIWYTPIALPAAIGIAVLMAGAVAMHVKVNDPPRKSLPAFSLLVLAVVIIAIRAL